MEFLTILKSMKLKKNVGTLKLLELIQKCWNGKFVVF